MRAYTRIAILLVLALLLDRSSYAAEMPPTDLRAVWIDSLHIKLTWTQTSSATAACFSKRNPANVSGFLWCAPTQPGRLIMIVPGPPPTDHLYHPHVGDEYVLQEQRMDDGPKRSNTTIVKWLRYLPMQRR